MDTIRRNPPRRPNNFSVDDTDFEQIRADLLQHDDTTYLAWMMGKYEELVRRFKATTRYQVAEDDAREIVLDGITHFKERIKTPTFVFDNVDGYLLITFIRIWYRTLRRKGIEIPSGDIFVDERAIYLEAEPDTTPQELENEQEQIALMKAVEELREDYKLIVTERYLTNPPSDWDTVAKKLSKLELPGRPQQAVSVGAAKKKWADTGFKKLKSLCNKFLSHS
jgi:DNA-directed RNA polymerase specialized sigma24 family protein